MIMMQGNDRIFDKVITEGGTAAARTISLYGVKALSDLQGVSLIVRANIGGSNSATTMKVNDLAATKLSVFKNGGIADADANWVVSGQLYMLYYDGVQFIAFPMSASSGSSSSSVEFADFPVDVLNLTTQSSESSISSAFGGAAKTAEFDALVQAGTKIIRFTNVNSFVYYTAIYYKQINVENSAVNDIIAVLHNYTDRTDLEMFTFVGTMTEDGDFEKYTSVVKETLYSSSQEGTLNNPRAFTGDANTKTTPGVYAITPFSNVPKNIPSGVSYGTMIVTTDEDASTITQTLQTSNTVYFRCKYSTNSWGDWVDLGASGGGSSSGDYLPLTGGTITGDLTLNGSRLNFMKNSKQIYYLSVANDKDMAIYPISEDGNFDSSKSYIFDFTNNSLRPNSNNSSAKLGTSVYHWPEAYIDTVHGTLDGKSSSSNKLTTARNITITGDEISDPVAFDGTKDITLSVTRKGASIGQSNSTNTNPWYKFAELSSNMPVSDDANIIFSVYSTFGDNSKKLGILKAHVRSNSTGGFETGELVWLVRSAESNILDLSDFVLAHDSESDSIQVELWCKCDIGWQGINFDVISESNRNNRSRRLWILFDTWSSGSASAVTEGLTQITSKDLTIGNSTSGNAATATTATTATKLKTARNINGVAFDGSANINITANPTTNYLTTNENLNNVTVPGFYFGTGGNSITNKPDGVDWFGLVVSKIAGKAILQELHAGYSSYVKYYSRFINNGSGSTWTDWVEIKLTDTTYSNATTSAAGLMSAADKTKLNGIATGATANSASTTTPKANGTAAVGTDTKFARGDHVHPAQTTITGNAGSATKLQTARTINGAAFNGTANINTFDSSYKVPGCYRMKSDSNPEINLPGGNNFIPLENFPMYSELGTNPLFTLNSDGTITVNKTCMLDFRGTWSVYGSGNTQNKIYSNITYYDSDMQGWMPLYSSPLVPTSTMAMTSYDADFGPGQMGMVMAGTKIRASLDSTNDTSGAVFSGQILGYSLFINVIYVKG